MMSRWQNGWIFDSEQLVDILRSFANKNGVIFLAFIKQNILDKNIYDLKLCINNVLYTIIWYLHLNLTATDLTINN